jgi:hypothetical protein
MPTLARHRFTADVVRKPVRFLLVPGYRSMVLGAARKFLGAGSGDSEETGGPQRPAPP